MAEFIDFTSKYEDLIGPVGLERVAHQRIELSAAREAQLASMSDAEIESLLRDLLAQHNALRVKLGEETCGVAYYGPREAHDAEYFRREEEKSENQRLKEEGRTVP